MPGRRVSAVHRRHVSPRFGRNPCLATTYVTAGRVLVWWWRLSVALWPVWRLWRVWRGWRAWRAVAAVEAPMTAKRWYLGLAVTGLFSVTPLPADDATPRPKSSGSNDILLSCDFEAEDW